MQLGRLRALAAAAAGTLIWAGSAHAATTDFATSFEATDPPPTWISTAERASGVTGPAPTGIPGNVTDTVVGVRASGENTGGGEVKENLVDGSPRRASGSCSRRPAGSSSSWPEPVAVVHYALTSANDAAGRDPRDWTLQGSQRREAPGRRSTHRPARPSASASRPRSTRFANTTAYHHYRLDITRNHGDDLRAAGRVAALERRARLRRRLGDMRSGVGAGPRGGYNAKSGAGFTGLKALEYGGKHTADGRAYSYNKVFDVDVRVTPRTELSYLIFPNFDPGRPALPEHLRRGRPGLHRRHLPQRPAARVDQHGARAQPAGPGGLQDALHEPVELQARADRRRRGGQADRPDPRRLRQPGGPASFGGWIDDITIDGSAAQRSAARVRRTGSSPRAAPTRAAASRAATTSRRPPCRTASTSGRPVTNAGSLSWLYEYHKANNADNLPTLQAFSASHEPSPWMGDRQTFQVMPSAAAGDRPREPVRARAGLPARQRGRPAAPLRRHVRERLMTEIAPTDHAAMFRFTFPGDERRA